MNALLILLNRFKKWNFWGRMWIWIFLMVSIPRKAKTKWSLTVGTYNFWLDSTVFFSLQFLHH